MRLVLLCVALLALIVPPSALAADSISSPDSLFSVRSMNGQIALVWTPVPTASAYVVYRGTSATDLHRIGVVTDSFFIDLEAAPGVQWYGVSSTDGTHTSDPHTANAGSDGEACVSSSGSKVTVNSQSCIGQRS